MSPAGASRPVIHGLRRGASALFTHWGGVARRLGLQISAVLYLIFAISFGAAGFKGWHLGRAISVSAELELALALVFAYFGLSSLVRATHPK